MNSFATRIDARIRDAEVQVKTLSAECRGRVRHLQRKLAQLQAPHDVDHNVVREVVETGEAISLILEEKRELIERIELMREIRNDELAASKV